MTPTHGASVTNLKSIMVLRIVLMAISILVGIIEGANIRQKTHEGFVVALVVGLIAMVVFLVAITMLFCRRYGAWRLYAYSLGLAIIAVLPMGVFKTSSIGHFIYAVSIVLDTLIVVKAKALDSTELEATEQDVTPNA